MYITINDIIGSKTIDLFYPVKGRDGSAVGLPRRRGPVGPGSHSNPKSQLLGCLETMFSIGYSGI